MSREFSNNIPGNVMLFQNNVGKCILSPNNNNNNDNLDEVG